MSVYFFSIFGKSENSKKEVNEVQSTLPINNKTSELPFNSKIERNAPLKAKKEFYVFDVSCVVSYCEIKQLNEPGIKYIKIPIEIFNKISQSFGYLHIQKVEKIKGSFKYFITAYYDLFKEYEIHIERLSDEKSSIFNDVSNIIK